MCYFENLIGLQVPLESCNHRKDQTICNVVLASRSLDTGPTHQKSFHSTQNRNEFVCNVAGVWISSHTRIGTHSIVMQCVWRNFKIADAIQYRRCLNLNKVPLCSPGQLCMHRGHNKPRMQHMLVNEFYP